MANTDNKFGLKPVRHAAGGCIRADNRYSTATGNTTAIYTGDIVELTNTSNYIQQIAAASNVDNLGVFAGCEFTDSNGVHQWKPYWPGTAGNSNIRCSVYTDPNIVYEVQADGLVAAEVGELTDPDLSTSGSTVTGLSGMIADVSTGATTGKSLRILGLVERPDNAYGANAKIEVQFAEHVLMGVVSGVGGI